MPVPSRRTLAVLSTVLVAACTNGGTDFPRTDDARRDQVANLVVIYAENRSFDNLYGRFPGAHGLGEVLDTAGAPKPTYAPQKDRDGSVLQRLPQTWGGVTAAGATPIVTQAQSGGLTNRPFPIETSFAQNGANKLTLATTTRDLYHRFYENQMQIGSGNDGFAAWSDAGGLAMGHYDTHQSALYALAKRYVLADHFFQGAFGGSFLNHQYLVCACAPEYPGADTAAAKPTIAVLDKDAAGRWLPRLTPAANAPASALDGPPVFVRSGNLTPANYFGDGRYYAVNTMQPAYQPSGNEPATGGDRDRLYGDPAKATTLPAQSAATIGDRLDAKGVTWAWYGQAWKAALADGTQAPKTKRRVIYEPSVARGDPNFQAHHQPFNYYAVFDPVTGAQARREHLRDYDDLVADAAAGRLPAVTFFKPQGNLNQHAGYANVADGDAFIADLVAKLQASPQWPNMMIVVTYDEFGGIWDHMPVPKGDLLGPGTRIPALVIAPFAKSGTVDHTPYDTGSIARFITNRWRLDPLPGIVARDRALVANGQPAMGDLSAALK